MKVAAQAEKLVKQFPEQLAVKGISFKLEENKIYGLIGRNGAGKTTTLKMLNGLIQPTSGKISVLGNNPRDNLMQHRQSVGYLPETVNYFRFRRTGDIIELASYFYNNWSDSQASELIHLLEIPTHKKVKALSQGNKQKLSILLSLCHHPKVLLLDEPYSHLDPVTKRKTGDFIQKYIKTNGYCALISSHHIHDLQQIVDDVFILNEGEIILEAPKNKLNSFKKLKFKSNDNIDNFLAGSKYLIKSEFDGDLMLLYVLDCPEFRTLLSDQSFIPISEQQISFDDIILLTLED